MSKAGRHMSKAETHARRAPLTVRAIALVTAMLGAMAISAAAVGAATLAPSAFTGGISGLTPSSVILHGDLNAHGKSTNYVFQYGITKGYGAQTPLAPGGAAATAIAVSQGVVGLQANTTYHYRILVTSGAGATAGADHSFKTPKVPLSLQIGGAPDPVPFGDPFAVQGTLFGTGGPGRVVALETNPFPYIAGFKTFGNPEVTSVTGSFSFPVVGLSTNTQVRVVTTTAPFISSPVVVEGVAVRVSFHVKRVHRHRRGKFVRMYGTVTPAEVGAHVGFQLIRPGAPSLNQGGAIVNSASPTVSSFSKIVRIRHRGTYEAIVQVFDGSHVSAYSAPIRIR
jgi:hypothetical protein